MSAGVRPGKHPRCVKIAYALKVDALLALNRREIRAVAGDAVNTKRAYYCRRCWRWHLTSQERPA